MVRSVVRNVSRNGWKQRWTVIRYARMSLGLFLGKDSVFMAFHCYIAQNACYYRDIYLQFTKYLRSVILPIIIQINASRRVSPCLL